MTTGNISSADIMAVMMSAKSQSGIISSGTQATESFQSIFGQSQTEGSQIDNSFETTADVDSIETAFGKTKANKTKDIVKADEAKEAGVDNEAFSQLSEEIKDVVTKELGISEEELSEAMSELGLTFADLLNPQNVANLIAHVENVEPAVIITDAGLTSHLTDIVSAINEMVSAIANNQQIPVEDVVSNFKTYAEQNDIVLNTDATQEQITTVTVETDAENGREVTITMEGNKVTETTTQITGTTENTESQSFASNDEKFAGAESQGQQNDSTEMFASNLMNNLTDSIQNSLGVQDEFSQIYNANASDIINQLIDSIRVNVTADTSTMELQLTPENLGKINLTVVAKDGGVTASITAQNDVVKAVIESQLVQLKEALVNQGLKVTDVEVTVANQAFDHNFENNGGQTKDEQKSSRKRFRGIDELTADNGEFEDSIIDRIIESEGSSVNLKA